MARVSKSLVIDHTHPSVKAAKQLLMSISSKDLLSQFAALTTARRGQIEAVEKAAKGADLFLDSDGSDEVPVSEG
jgi:regulator of sirC expression with transglutaminase-like and TPR domain